MEKPALASTDRRTVAVVTGLSAVAFAATVIAVAIAVTQSLTLRVLSIDSALLNDPAPFPSASGESVTATVSSVDLSVTDAPAGLRALIAGAAITGALLPLSVCAALFFLGLTIIREHFRLRAAFALATLAVIAFAGSIFTPLLNGMAASEALRLGPLGNSAPFAFTVGGDTLFVPAFLLAVAALMMVGARLQRETEGLI